MSEYYAVQRSDEYLAHYGIKGMKWGVRKAIEKREAKLNKYAKRIATHTANIKNEKYFYNLHKGNGPRKNPDKEIDRLDAMRLYNKMLQQDEKKLKKYTKKHQKTQDAMNRAIDKQYNKAQKKLAKLNAKADISLQEKKASKYNKASKIAGKVGFAGAGLAVAGTGANHTLHLINSLYKNIAKAKLADLDREGSKALNEAENELFYYAKNRDQMGETEFRRVTDELAKRHSERQDAIANEHRSVVDDFNKGKDRRKLGADIGRYAGYAGAAAGAAGLSTAAITKAKAIAAKKRTTEKGHAKAVMKRDAWQKEMNKAFAGTKYSKKRR